MRELPVRTTIATCAIAILAVVAAIASSPEPLVGGGGWTGTGGGLLQPQRDPCELVLDGTAPTLFHHTVPFAVATGLLSEMRADEDFSRATCLGPFDVTPSPDPSQDPPAGDGRYYLARGATCPGYGSSSLEPDPRSDLLLNDPCPFCLMSDTDLLGTWHYCEDCDKTGLQPQSCIEFGGDNSLEFILPNQECCDCPGSTCVNNLSTGTWVLDAEACTVRLVIGGTQIADPVACWVEPLDVVGTVTEYDGDTLILDFGGPVLSLERDASMLPCYCETP